MLHCTQSHQQDHHVVRCPLVSPKPCLGPLGRSRGSEKACVDSRRVPEAGEMIRAWEGARQVLPGALQENTLTETYSNSRK